MKHWCIGDTVLDKRTGHFGDLVSVDVVNGWLVVEMFESYGEYEGHNIRRDRIPIKDAMNITVALKWFWYVAAIIVILALYFNPYVA